MKLKAFVPAFALVLAAGTAWAETYQIDAKASQLGWAGRKVTGAHNGALKLKSGSIELDKKGEITGGSFEIDMTSLTNEDLKGSPEYQTKLVNHLKSDDFFSVEKHPVARFKLTSANAVKGRKDATHEITGDMTIKGITKKVTFPARITRKGDKAEAKAKIKLDRTLWDIRYGSGKFFENLGDKMIYDEFDVDLNLIASKKS